MVSKRKQRSKPIPDVPASGDKVNHGDIPDPLKHRQQFVAFVLAKSVPFYRQHLGDLYHKWYDWNDRYFEGALHPPYITFGTPSHPRAEGDYRNVSHFGGLAQIQVRFSILIGEHPSVRPGEQYAAGRILVCEDILLHEAVHQWQDEIVHDLEDSYAGHGPTFRDKCNAIGQALGLPPVRTGKARGADAHLPSCAYWPTNVRPKGYYLGAYVDPTERKSKRPQRTRGEAEDPAPTPPPPEVPWPALYQRWYREMSLRFHPDRGGDVEAMKAINVSADRLKELLGETGVNV